METYLLMPILGPSKGCAHTVPRLLQAAVVLCRRRVETMVLNSLWESLNCK